MNLEQKPLVNAIKYNSASDVDGHQEEWVSLSDSLLVGDDVGGMVVKSVNMRRVLKTIQRLGPYKASVLIHGESGTGKELVARALHTLGPVPKGPFVTFNCSNLVESLAESQLFRPHSRRLHRRARGLARLLSLGQRRHAVSRRDRRVAVAAAAQAVARGRDSRGAAGRLGAQLQG
jgi:AAA+ superfamily predicted ATPase